MCYNDSVLTLGLNKNIYIPVYVLILFGSVLRIYVELDVLLLGTLIILPLMERLDICGAIASL